MARVMIFPKVRPKSLTRGAKTRATRFANDVDKFCEWYFTGTNKKKRAKVNDKVRWLKRRAKQAGKTR